MESTDKKIQEIQILEQNLHNVLLQKQNFQIEISETQNALEELEISGEETYKIIGQLMLKSDKEKMKKELTDKQETLELRIKTLEKQENEMVKRIGNLREEIMSSMKK